MAQVFLGIGSNEGDRLAHISRAIRQLGCTPGIHVTQMATIQETEPIGGPPQGRFLNTVVELETTLSPRELFTTIKQLERDCGRRPSPQRWGPRPLDLDILLYDQETIEEPDLAIPHQQMHRRRFVLEPLAQLAPHLRHPLLRQTIAELLQQLPDSSTAGA